VDVVDAFGVAAHREPIARRHGDGRSTRWNVELDFSASSTRLVPDDPHEPEQSQYGRIARGRRHELPAEDNTEQQARLAKLAR
jgi:hypothetical protein